MWDLLSLWALKGCGTGPTVCFPYPRRLQSLTIYRRYYKGSAFYSVILGPWVLVRPRFWTCDLPHSSPMLKHRRYNPQRCSNMVGTTHTECRVRNQTQSTMVIGLPSPADTTATSIASYFFLFVVAHKGFYSFLQVLIKAVVTWKTGSWLFMDLPWQLRIYIKGKGKVPCFVFFHVPLVLFGGFSGKTLITRTPEINHFRYNSLA